MPKARWWCAMPFTTRMVNRPGRAIAERRLRLRHGGLEKTAVAQHSPSSLRELPKGGIVSRHYSLRRLTNALLLRQLGRTTDERFAIRLYFERSVLRDVQQLEDWTLDDERKAIAYDRESFLLMSCLALCALERDDKYQSTRTRRPPPRVLGSLRWSTPRGSAAEHVENKTPKGHPSGRPFLFSFRCRASIWSGRRDSNPRRPPWQGGTLPLSYSRNPLVSR
jgi:hypothetical protein